MNTNVLRSINPWTEETVFEIPCDTADQISEKIEQAAQAYKIWSKTSLNERSAHVKNLANTLRKHKAVYAEAITSEMGKPILQSKAEIEKCAWVCDYYAENAPHFLSDRSIQTDASKSFVRYSSIGPLLAVMPWNYPFWQYFRFIAPNLMAGNVGLLKHASNVPQCAMLLQQVFFDASLPTGVSQTLLIASDQVASVIKNDVVRGVTLTGSGQAGSSVAQIAGKEIKKTVLELGGSNAVIVFDDADVKNAVSVAKEARFQNTGQSCIAGKRILVHQNVYHAFLSTFVSEVKLLSVWNPMDESTEIGPMATLSLAKELEQQLSKSVEMGATILVGGTRNGTKFQPTVLADVTSDMPVCKEETFGPLAVVIPFSTEEEAIQLNNMTPYGLGVSLCTSDESRINRMIDQLEEGAVFVNEMVKSDPRLPFGGVKKSGYGRELSKEGLLEFMNIKTVYIK